MPELKTKMLDAIRAAGGFVHSDGNIFFTSSEQFRVAAEAITEASPAIGDHDIRTSAGGRAYVAEFFVKLLRRNDFGRYIKETLAADFACALAKGLSEIGRGWRATPATFTHASTVDGDERDHIALAKAMLVLVDEYHERPSTDTRNALRVALTDEFSRLLAHAALSADGGEISPSLTNSLTPYGMLVRALRIVADTTLMEMAQRCHVPPSHLSASEFGRKTVTDDDAMSAAVFFASKGIAGTLGMLQAAIAASTAKGAQS